MVSNILFIVNNNDACIDAFEPVIKVIKAKSPHTQCIGLSATEFLFDTQTDHALFQRVFDKYDVLCEKLPAFAASINDEKIKDTNDNSSVSKNASKADVVAANSFLPKYLIGEKISAIVVVNDRLFPEWHAIQIANEFKIPSLLIQESVRKDEGFIHDDVIHGQGGCTKIAAWGENGKDYFQKVGATGEIIITGSSRVDKFYAQGLKLEKENIRKRLGLPVNANLVLFASNALHYMNLASHKDYNNLITTIAQTTSQIGEKDNNTHLLIKPHRQEIQYFIDSGYFNYISSLPNVLYRPKIGLSAAIAAADSVVLFNSTVAIEAAIFGKKVGMVNLFNNKMYVDFVERGISEYIDTKEKLADFIKSSASGEEERTKIIKNAQYYVTNLGQSAKKVAECVFGML